MQVEFSPSPKLLRGYPLSVLQEVTTAEQGRTAQHTPPPALPGSLGPCVGFLWLLPLEKQLRGLQPGGQSWAALCLAQISELIPSRGSPDLGKGAVPSATVCVSDGRWMPSPCIATLLVPPEYSSLSACVSFSRLSRNSIIGSIERPLSPA